MEDTDAKKGMPILILALLCLALSASGCSLSSAPKSSAPSRTAEYAPRVSGAAISKTALTTVGTPYVYGGSTPKGFDCSGMVAWAYARNGIQVPRTAREQSAVGTSVSRSALKPGDLVVFRLGRGLHTGIYTGKGRFVHSPSTGKKVRVDSVNSQYWRGRFIAGRRHARVY